MSRTASWRGPATALVLLLLSAGLALMAGRYPVPPADLARVLWSRLSHAPSGVPAAVEAVILNIRGPRVLAAILVGSALATAGAAFQGLFRNPLVSPDLLGASSGAALGAVLGIYLSLGVVGIQALSFAGGLVAVACVYAIGHRLRGPDSALTLVLTGVIIGALLGALVGLVKALADPYNQLPAITFWLLGSLSGITAADLPPLLLPVAAGTAIMLGLRWRLNVLSLPEDEARSLGLSTDRLRLIFVVAATLVTAAGVSAAGIVGWVGLVVPHLARFATGPNFARLLPVSAVLGGTYLLVIDTLARTMAPVEVPLGILTALVGTPLFLVLMSRRRTPWT